MDSLTHLVLGAVTGEVAARKQIGRKALVMGAAAQYLPDLDVMAALWLDPADNLIAHRGITHSFLFVVTASIVLAWIARSVFKNPVTPWSFWIGFFALQFSLHIFIDAFNAYGAGWLEPFSNEKISFHTLYVVDPFFTLPLIVSLIALLLARQARFRKQLALYGLGLAGLYLLIAIGMRWKVVATVKSDTTTLTVQQDNVLVTPTPLNSLLFFVAVGDHSGFYTGHVSVFDDSDPTRYTYFLQKETLLESSNATSTIRTLKSFSNGFYIAELWGDTLVFNDLRFGQMKGWMDPRGKFVFHYFVDYPRENTLVMQRGRFAGWDSETVQGLLVRMRGGNVSRVDESKK
jgi:inner membrane protein